jgi:hypothetical protein
VRILIAYVEFAAALAGGGRKWNVVRFGLYKFRAVRAWPDVIRVAGWGGGGADFAFGLTATVVDLGPFLTWTRSLETNHEGVLVLAFPDSLVAMVDLILLLNVRCLW